LIRRTSHYHKLSSQNFHTSAVTSAYRPDSLPVLQSSMRWERSIRLIAYRCCNIPVQFSMPEPTPSDLNRSSQVGLPSCTGWIKANRLIDLNLHFEGVANGAETLSNYPAFSGIAVDVFKTRNLDAIQSLKKFLTALPSPSYIREALLQAIYQLAEHDLETYQWILRHHQHLQPELSLIQVAQQVATEQLQNQGLVKAALFKRVSIGDRLLLKEILFF
jgi:hypothetical protein